MKIPNWLEILPNTYVPPFSPSRMLWTAHKIGIKISSILLWHFLRPIYICLYDCVCAGAFTFAFKMMSQLILMQMLWYVMEQHSLTHTHTHWWVWPKYPQRLCGWFGWENRFKWKSQLLPLHIMDFMYVDVAGYTNHKLDPKTVHTRCIWHASSANEHERTHATIKVLLRNRWQVMYISRNHLNAILSAPFALLNFRPMIFVWMCMLVRTKRFIRDVESTQF